MNDVEKIRREIFGTKEQISIPANPLVNPELLRLFPPSRLVRIQKRELRRFKQRQGVKWSRWLEAVSQ